jgi:hypothetical protein
MPAQGLFLMIFMLVVFPAVIIFSNHNAFFVIVGFIVLILSFKNINMGLFYTKKEDIEDIDDELIEDLELIGEVDVKKFGIGFILIRNIIFIIFLVYCSFFLISFYLKMLTAAVIILWIRDTLKTFNLKDENMNIGPELSIWDRILLVLSGAGTTAVIVLTTCNKFIKMVL